MATTGDVVSLTARALWCKIIHEQPIYPKNRYLDKIPGKHADYKREVIDKQVTLMQKRGIWKKQVRKVPATDVAAHDGAVSPVLWPKCPVEKKGVCAHEN